MQITSCSCPKSPPFISISIHKMGLSILQTGGPFVFLEIFMLLAGKGRGFMPLSNLAQWPAPQRPPCSKPLAG